jgi:hypothetical protein
MNDNKNIQGYIEVCDLKVCPKIAEKRENQRQEAHVYIYTRSTNSCAIARVSRVGREAMDIDSSLSTV